MEPTFSIGRNFETFMVAWQECDHDNYMQLEEKVIWLNKVRMIRLVLLIVILNCRSYSCYILIVLAVDNSVKTNLSIRLGS